MFVLYQQHNLRRRFRTSKMLLSPPPPLPSGFLVEGGGSVVVDPLLINAPIVCRGSVSGPCFVIQYLLSF